jgi:hypothetical protein
VKKKFLDRIVIPMKWLAVPIIALTAEVAAQNAQGLQRWVGRYPLEKITGKTFFQVGEPVLSLKKKLPRKEYNLLTGGNYIQAPISIIDSFLITSRCKPHCCPCDNVWIAVSVNSKKYLIAFQNHRLVRCYSVGLQLAQLPNSLKEIFLETFIPRMNSDDHLYDNNHWIDTVKSN